jgi:hypothetical protein
VPNPFRLLKQDPSGARLGELALARGTVPTPTFMPVGTLAAVKGVTPVQVAETGAGICLANTYHLALQPGADKIAKLGGLHAFMGWKRPILTDSGGFQVFSLPRKEITDRGVRFHNEVDGSEMDLTPERATQIQHALGADILMAFDEFIAGLSDASVDPDTEEMTEIFQNAGFKSGGVDTRFYGEVHTPGSSTHVVSSFIELESEEGATSALDWIETDSKKPCPMSCATQISTFDVDDIPDARGVRRIATADDIERVGTTDQRPFESYLVAFANGAFVYTVDLFGQPGSVTEAQALDIAGAYYDRLTDS